jgi:hypothetical protein
LKKVTKSKKIKRLDHKKIITENDIISGKLVKERDHHICQICGQVCEGRNCTCAHIISRTSYALRWDLDNLFCADYRCHIYKFHSSPLFAVDFLKEKYGEEYLNDLKARDITVHVTDEFLLEWNALLKKYYLEVFGHGYKK